MAAARIDDLACAESADRELPGLDWSEWRAQANVSHPAIALPRRTMLMTVSADRIEVVGWKSFT